MKRQRTQEKGIFVLNAEVINSTKKSTSPRTVALLTRKIWILISQKLDILKKLSSENRKGERERSATHLLNLFFPEQKTIRPTFSVCSSFFFLSNSFFLLQFNYEKMKFKNQLLFSEL
jgi:hypothetical protein